MKSCYRYKAYIASFRFTLLIVILLCFGNFGWGQTQTYSTAGTYNFTIPVGVTSLNVQAWGGGGCSGQNTEGRARGGGGGGAFTGGTISVTPGTILTVVVGAGGIYNNNATSTDDGFASSAGGIVANGGSRGVIGNNSVTLNGGAGGTISSNPGGVLSFISYAGGNGGNGYVTGDNGGGGGGGESASPTGTGNAGGNGTNAGVGGAGGTGNASGGDGGRGSDNDGNPNSTIGTSPGGGGGGRGDDSGNDNNGAAGQVILTWTPCTAPSITTQPTNQAASAGTSATFSVTATGTGLTYQWRKGTNNITDATNASYTINAVSTADAATDYNVVITGACGTVTSANASLTVYELPIASVTNQSNLSCFASADGEITIKATGGSGNGYEFSIDNGAHYVCCESPDPDGDPTTYKFTGLIAGIEYRVRVKDSNGSQSSTIP